MSTIERTESPLPTRLEKYEGQWIALRAGRVVAHAESIEDLTRDSRVRTTDVLYRVPESGTYFY